MNDIYMYTSKGYKPVERDDWEEPTPLWVGIVEVLREFPRTIKTIQYGLDIYYGWQVPAHVASAELTKLASEGFVALTDSHVDALCGYKLTQNGLLLQAGDTQSAKDARGCARLSACPNSRRGICQWVTH